jgi:hypothetical protein
VGRPRKAGFSSTSPVPPPYTRKSLCSTNLGGNCVVARIVRTFGSFRVETTDWPLIYMDCGTFLDKDEDLRGALACIEQVMRECARMREKCVQVTDLSSVQTMPSAAQRKLAGDWMTSTLDLQRTVSLGGASVTPSTIVRGIVTAIQWIQKPPTPLRYFATRREAMLQAFQWLEEGRVFLPPALLQLRDKLTADARELEKRGSGWSGWRNR